MKKVKAKAAKAKLTPKQMSIKAVSLLKGIDNSVAVIDKHRTHIIESAGQLAGILSGLSNAATETSAPAKKPTSAPAKKPIKAEKKPVKAGKKAAAPTKKAGKKVAKKSAGQKSPVANRPTIKEAIKEAISEGGPSIRAILYHKVTDKYGYWSHQSFYNALKDKKSFKEVDDEKIDVVQVADRTKTTDAEAAKFVERVAGDAIVSSVT